MISYSYFNGSHSQNLAHGHVLVSLLNLSPFGELLLPIALSFFCLCGFIHVGLPHGLEAGTVPDLAKILSRDPDESDSHVTQHSPVKTVPETFQKLLGNTLSFFLELGAVRITWVWDNWQLFCCHIEKASRERRQVETSRAIVKSLKKKKQDVTVHKNISTQPPGFLVI